MCRRERTKVESLLVYSRQPKIRYDILDNMLTHHHQIASYFLSFEIHEENARKPFLKYFLSRCPFLRRLSWITSTAYHANFRFITRDYQKSLELCNSVLSHCARIEALTEFLESAFTVQLSNFWSPVFDSELQTVFGLVTLCRSRSSVGCHGYSSRVSVCPVLFSHYIKVRCLLSLCCDDQSVATAMAEFQRHATHACRCPHADTVAGVLSAALRCIE